MQNWNQWQMPAGAVTAPMPPTPAGLTAPGADPMAMMQSYMQYYNQPAPSGYTAEQWAAAQQQNWTQWQQWQQQFQQWQAQYGEKYQETMKQLSAQGLSLPNVTQVPPLPSSQPLPPLPKEENKPPLPPDTNNPYQYANMPPPHQNNLPLFPAKSQNSDYKSKDVATYSQAPPLPPGQPPPSISNPQESLSVNLLGEKRGINEPGNFGSAKKSKIEDEELTEAEKTFDAQFKQWEEQFNKWKQQNANHPDKTQYKQYEAKWTSWREKLIERREQMRKKREQQKQIMRVEQDKNKNIPGGDKILNILSSSENQGLINNLLGIGKTLGLTGKLDGENSSTSSANINAATSLMQQPAGMIPPTMTSDMTQAAWAAQQWAAQYNAVMGTPNYAGYQMVAGMAAPSNSNQSSQAPGNNFSQPPPYVANSGMNFSQPPPGYGASDSRQTSGPGVQQSQRNMHDRPPPLFGPESEKREGFVGGEQFSQSIDRFQSSNDYSDHNRDRFAINDRMAQGSQFSARNNRFGQETQKGSGGNQFGSESERSNQGADRFGGGRPGNEFGSGERGGLGSQFRLDADRPGSNEDRDSGSNRFSRDSDSFAPSNDRFGSNSRVGSGISRSGREGGNFGPGNDRFGSDIDRFSSGNDHFGSNPVVDPFAPGSQDRFGPEKDRFGPGSGFLGVNNDRSGPGNERLDFSNSRFTPVADRENLNKSLGFAGDNFGPRNERFNRTDRPDVPDPFEPKDPNYINDNRRDSFGDSSRGSNRNVRSFEANDSIAPELRKLMEKRRAAMDVFKPRDDVFNSVKQDNIGSLSESFKKITGELPYASRGPVDTGPRNLPGQGPRGPDNFMSRGPGDFACSSMGAPLRGGNNFGQQPPRGMEFGGFGNSGGGKFRSGGEFGPLRSEFGPLRGPGDFGLRGRGDFETRLSSDGSMIEQPGALGVMNKDGAGNSEQLQDSDNRGKGRPKNEESESFVKPNSSEHGDEILRKDGMPKLECNPNISPLERPPWMDAQFPEQKSNENAEGAKGNLGMKPDSSENAEADKPTVLDEPKPHSENKDHESGKKNQNQQRNEPDKSGLQHDNAKQGGKDQNALPFMGENDPKPEDLNMEPPPELPNLGPITDAPNMPTFKPNSQNNEPGNAFSPRPPPLLAQRGPNSPFFDAPGPAAGQFRPGGPNVDQFSSRGPNMNRFESRAPNDRQFAPRNPGDGMYGPRGPHFGPRGLLEGPFGPRGLGDGQFGPRGPAPFGPRGVQDGQSEMPPQRGPNDGLLGPRPTDESFGPMGRGFLGPRGPGVGQYGPRPPNHSQVPLLRGSNEGQFRPRGSNEANYGARGPIDGQKPAIPSLLGLQFDKQPTFDASIPPGNALNQANNDFIPSGIHPEDNKTIDGRRPFAVAEPDQKLSFPMDQRAQFSPSSAFPQARPPGLEQRPPFAQGGPELRPPFERDTLGNAGQRSPFAHGGPMSNENRPLNRQGGLPPNLTHLQGGSDQRAPFAQSGPRGLDNPPMAQGFDQRIDQNILEQRPPFMGSGHGNLDKIMLRGREQRSDFDPNLRGNDQKSPFLDTRKGIAASKDINSKFDGEFYDRSRGPSDSGRPPRSSAIDEFCVGKQFNYNHGGSATDKKTISEIIPGKVVDYGHMTKVAVHEYITPVQTFEYGHGNLKPVVPEHEIISRRDFRHWEETEQNLKEYDDRLRLYERQQRVWPSRAKPRDSFKFETPNPRERDWSKKERSYESDDRRLYERDVRARRDRSIREECKERERERERDRERVRDDRDYEYGRDFDREERSRRDGNDRRDKKREADERSDRMKVDQNREHNKDDDRSKDSVSRQEYQNKSNANTSQESSTSEAKNDSVETTSKKMELSRVPNYTMVDDILFQPGRQTRPPKIVIILRGPPGSGKSFVAKLIKDKEVEQGGSAPRILSLDDYFLVEKEKETKDDNGKKVVVKEMVYEYEEAMEQSYLTSLVKAFKKNITDGYFNFIILDCINEKISDYEEMWSFAKTKGFQVYVCEMEMDVHICMKRNIHNRTEEEINKIVDYFEPTPNYHLKLDVNAMLQEAAIDEVQMEDSQQSPEETAAQTNEDSQDSQDDKVGVSKWEKMDADDKLDRLDGLAKKKNEVRPQTMEDFLQVPDYYNMEDTPGKKRVRWADLEERKEQEKLRAVGFVVGHTNWDRMMDPTKGQSALTRTKYI